MIKKECKCCADKLNKDTFALNRKLLGNDVAEVMCLTCLADYISCTTDDLLVKIEEYKEQGCTLFI